MKIYCLRSSKKDMECILHEGDACSFFGFILSGVVKYSCTNRTENKPYNVGFSFPNEFIADYPTCLYGMKSELNIQAIIPCEIYICSSAFLQQKFKENNENQRIARIAAEQMFFLVAQWLEQLYTSVSRVRIPSCIIFLNYIFQKSLK